MANVQNYSQSKKVFLGGTISKNDYRSTLIPHLTINYFNPLVSNWTPECQQEEIRQRNECDILLYVITPEMTGVYSIAEVTEDAISRPEKTVFAFWSIPEIEFTDKQIASLEMVASLIEKYGAKTFRTMDSLVQYLNNL